MAFRQACTTGKYRRNSLMAIGTDRLQDLNRVPVFFDKSRIDTQLDGKLIDGFKIKRHIQTLWIFRYRPFSGLRAL